MLNFVRAFLHRRRQRQAEAAALRNSEHAWAIRIEAARAYGNECALVAAERNAPSLPSQELAREIEELRSGKVTPLRRQKNLRTESTNRHIRGEPPTAA